MDQPATEFDYPLVPGSVKKAMSAAEAGSRDLWQVPPAKIRLIPGFNARVKDGDYHAHIRSLTESIKTEGFKQHKPLAGYVVVENGENIIYVYDGHCRFEAALDAIAEGADIPRLPVVVAQGGANLQDLTVELVRSNEGKPLKPIEKAIVCKRLAGYGWEIGEIARRLGFTPQYVSDLLLLVGSPMQVVEMVQAGEVSAATAIEAVKKSGDKVVSVLTAAREKANAAGKSKVTRKHVTTPASEFEKTAKKHAVEVATLFLKVEQTLAEGSDIVPLVAEMQTLADTLRAAKGGEL